ncbi:hemolysin family protein [Oscillospiraceae bacterium LTW-04]|nr:hemolysin family protein [Oscillospiraceae bacterium MB24-C1]
MIPKTSWAAVTFCVVLPLLLSFLLNLAEAGAVYLNDTKLKQLVSSADKKALRLDSLLHKHRSFRLSVQFIALLCLVLAVVHVCLWTVGYFSEVYALGFNAAILFFWVCAVFFALIFFAVAVIAPRRIAGFLPSSALALSWLLSLTLLLFAPLTFLIELISNILVRLSGYDPNSDPDSVTEEEIRMLVDEGNERGAIEESEKNMINNIFEFDSRDVSQVMTHRTELSAVELHATLEEVARIAIESGYSRLPVYDEDIDSICGIIYAKDLIKYIHRPEAFHLSEEMRRPIYVPESSSCSDVFALFNREKVQIAIVVDEYGGTYGIVTMEDLLESIVGNIQDEYDNEEVLVTQEEDGTYVLDGSIGISDAEQLFNFHVPDDSEADTLGGFMIELLGGVPHQGEDPRAVIFGGVTFSVLRSDERRIEKIKAVIHSDAE